MTHDTASLRALADRYTADIKHAISGTFGASPDALTILSDDPSGVYMSEQAASTFCALVLGQTDGHLYIVTALFNPEDDTLTSFRADTVS